MSITLQRHKLAALHGKQFGGDRDLYEVLGYKRALTNQDLYEEYRRGDIAHRIVNAFPAATWRAKPIIRDGEIENETPFTQRIEQLLERNHLWHYCERADRMAGIGRYGVLVLGLNDGADLSEPVNPSTALELLWLKPVPEVYAEIIRWVTDPTDRRFGQPLIYNVTLGSEEDTTKPNTTKQVHYSRIIHVAENMGMDDVYGIPRLEPVYNRLYDLAKVVGSSAEMFWLGARNGMQFVANADANVTDVDALEDEAEEFHHQLRRTLLAEGGQWQTLESQTPDPTGNVNTLLDIIAGTVGIPKRILIGSERGELASTQDENNWLGRIEERRTNHVEPVIILQLINRLIELNVVDPPSEDVVVEWPMQTGLSETDLAQIGKTKTEALATYVNALGTDSVVTIEEFREQFLGLEPEIPLSSIEMGD